ncbi:MAG: glycerol-3-phosphate acyltransferase [Candidatus Paceibacterota bacterium]|jgi:glycerol-3-phosphate acyltransferase PlsY
MDSEVLKIFLALTASYLMGSFPSGYLISKKVAKKNILEVGWKKSSGSNVYKNIGRFAGIATGLIDISKGVLAIWLAQYLGLGQWGQIFCGLAAVIGHNWSVFLGFAGGRGIGTFGGALAAFSPWLFAWAVLLFAASSLVWTGSIGTILAFFLSAWLAFNVYGSPSAGWFSLLVMVPVFIKRLSPIKEVIHASGEGKTKLIKNRLIFDQDEVPPLRIPFLKPKA